MGSSLSSRSGKRCILPAVFGGIVIILGLFGCSENPIGVEERQPAVVAQVTAPIHMIGQLPARWNGSVVVYAHGFVPAIVPLAIPSEAAQFGELAMSSGFAFATTSYPENGMCIPEALADIVSLVEEFKAEYPQTQKVFLIGASMGGLVAAQAAERHPETFDGVLALCGVYGNYTVESGYIANFRVIFDYFFPGVLPGDAITVDLATMLQWESVYMPNVQAELSNPANTGKIRQLLAVTKLPVNASDPASVANAIIEVLFMQIFATEDVRLRLGGYPYGNRYVRYSGSDNDRALNAGVQRFSADPVALLAAQRLFGTTGRLQIPLVSMHGTGDNLVPIIQQLLYRTKIFLARKSRLYTGIPVNSYGHCQFQEQQILNGFGLLVSKVTGVLPQLTSTGGDGSVCISCK
ncbi:MAG: alpha/beta fold hydrolase [Chitinispirillaceae bacterium]|nr:alpha/beta fold hydrolase [Chitinispirillaceae bacterium]